jgi:uncharacterized damage-inducible protein DinB
MELVLARKWILGLNKGINMNLELIKTFTQYHLDMTRRVWKSIDHITEEQFLANDAYSRGSLRNLMVHLAATDSNWLAGLKNIPEDQDPPARTLEDYSSRAIAREFWDTTAKDVADYIETLTEAKLNENPVDIPHARWQVLLHMSNHGTDHRSTILQRLHELGAPTFEQDFIFWLWNKNELC